MLWTDNSLRNGRLELVESVSTGIWWHLTVPSVDIVAGYSTLTTRFIISKDLKEDLIKRCQRVTWPLAQVASEFSKKQQSGKQNKTLTCPARQVTFWPQSSQCVLLLFNRVAGQVNFKGSLPCSASYVLKLMLHPACLRKTVTRVNCQ